jgi:hypothetical protein
MKKALIITKCTLISSLITSIIYGLINHHVSLIDIAVNVYIALITTTIGAAISLIPLAILMLKKALDGDSNHKYPTYFTTLTICNAILCVLSTSVKISVLLHTSTSEAEAMSQLITDQKNTWLLFFGFATLITYLEHALEPIRKKIPINKSSTLTIKSLKNKPIENFSLYLVKQN